MKKFGILLLAAFLLAGCMATTPTQTSTSTTAPGGSFLAWYCYEGWSDAQDGGRNYIFYAYSSSDQASVNVHGEDVPARFTMDGLDAQYAFGPEADNGRFNYLLTIQPDGRAVYRTWESGDFRYSATYHCRKASKSR